MAKHYDELLARMREVSNLSSVAALLGWDQETMMPPEAAAARAEQLALVGGLVHERATDSRLGELLSACEADPELAADEATAANLREMRWDYERARKLPAELVIEINETSSRALEVWKQARRESNFDLFRPWLAKQVDLHRRKAECYGAPPGGELYDALVEDYEPGMTGARLEAIFSPLRAELAPLIAAIAASSTRIDPTPNEIQLPLDRQRELSRLVLERVGFRTRGGRLDDSVHPFSSGIAPGDTRLTTRYQADQFTEALGSTMHEAGHALYEQGLPKREHWGQPLGEAGGLGLHESQSRLWENHVGRSRAFWTWALPEARRLFGSALADVELDDVYRAANTVRPNLIRVESDEATYNLHIMLRFDLERALLRGDLGVGDLPGAWNERVERDLGLKVPDDARGCLQDIHWSMGAIGYFPTYTLGSLYAAQFWEALVAALPETEQRIAAGDFSPVLDWLRANVHRHGRRWSAEQLCARLTGRPLSHEPLLRHLETKFKAIYGL